MIKIIYFLLAYLCDIYNIYNIIIEVYLDIEYIK